MTDSYPNTGANAPLVLSGTEDAIQLKVQANGTQTQNIIEVDDSTGNPYFIVDHLGNVLTQGLLKVENGVTVYNYSGAFITGSVTIQGHGNTLTFSEGSYNMSPITAPTAPSSGFTIYCDSADNKLKAISSAGTITNLALP